MKPRAWSLRTMAEPTRPRWPATKILADLSERKEDEVASVERRREITIESMGI